MGEQITTKKTTLVKIKLFLTMLFSASVFLACGGSEDYEAPQPNPNPTPTPNPTPNPSNPGTNNPGTSTKNIAISFFDPNSNISARYEAVKIGEYLWFNNYINHYPASIETTRSQIDLVLLRYRLNAGQYKTSLNDINKYYGLYYNRKAFEYLESNRHIYQIKENDKNAPSGGWGAPSNADAAQLFAMCGNGTERDVRTTLTCKAGSNPAAIANYTYWFSNQNTNKYGFNLMPGGARFHANDKWTLKHDHNDNDVEIFNVVAGDFYGFVEAAVLVTWDGRVTIDDYIKIDKNKSWHLMPIRWCRKLTDQELGYKLYINKSQTDIRKLGLKDPVPSGYTELKNGALRGFYVQFIINGVKPNASVAEMVKLAKTLS